MQVELYMENFKNDGTYKNIENFKIDYNPNNGININNIKVEILKILGKWSQRLEYKINIFYENFNITTKVFIKYDRVKDRCSKIDKIKKDINESRYI